MPAYVSIVGYADPPRIPLLSLEVNCGEMVAVAGPPGSGRPRRGALRILGQKAGAAAVRSRSVYVFQDHNFAPGRPVWSQLVARLPLWGGSPEQARARLEAWCDAFGLVEAAGREPARMNLAQLRLLALAPVALCRPAVAFLDEPLVGVPADMTIRALEMLTSLRERCAILVMTQEDSPVCRSADRVVTTS